MPGGESLKAQPDFLKGQLEDINARLAEFEAAE
jgi:hypothetical protein